MAAKRPTNEQVHFWAFAGSVAQSNHRAPMPEDLRQSYDEAVREAEQRATACVAGIDERAGHGLL